jgi:hypothetical protein
MPAGKTTATATCRRVAGGLNWHDSPDVTIKVDRRDAYQQCCAECRARAENGTLSCVAFSVNSWCGARGAQGPRGPTGRGVSQGQGRSVVGKGATAPGQQGGCCIALTGASAIRLRGSPRLP